ncbi:MAG: DUF5916 domain-containing protein, partial [Flavobacteriaceae bacterium]|nr:DUF5916 domain-containing protein [Flavobacteriaceae bacterium]
MYKPNFALSFIALIFISTTVFSQRQFTVKYISEKIELDGNLSEDIWNQAGTADDFWQFFPTDSVKSGQKTSIKFLYDDKNLYVAIQVFSSDNNYVVPSLQRDFRAGGSDNISLVFDTFNDGTTAFLFGTNPYGVQREALISNGGADTSGFSTAWDVKWKAETKQYDKYFISEIEIPLTSFKFKEGETKWRFNSYRFDTQNNETSSWANIPQNQSIFGLAYMGDMIFEKPLGKHKTPMAIIPSLTSFIARDYETNKTSSDVKVSADAKISLGNSMNLDITLNPDFSQVENDNLVTNTTRFEISLPERRQFFTDNSDL